VHDLWIRILIESFLVILINFMIHLTETYWGTAKDVFSSSFVVVGLMGAVLFSVLVWNFLRKNLEVLTHPRVYALWSSLYGTMTTQRLGPVLYILLFLVRRILFAATAVFLKDYGLLQLLCLQAQSLALLGYLIYFWPFVYLGLNFLEVFNEVCILSITYVSITFTGYHWDQTPEEFTRHGWWVVGIIAFNVAVNLLVVVWEICRGVRKWTLVLYYKLRTSPKTDA
jgi:hypothetical protein